MKNNEITEEFGRRCSAMICNEDLNEDSIALFFLVRLGPRRMRGTTSSDTKWVGTELSDSKEQSMVRSCKALICILQYLDIKLFFFYQ